MGQGPPWSGGLDPGTDLRRFENYAKTSLASRS
jgi:hypothetical protein